LPRYGHFAARRRLAASRPAAIFRRDDSLYEYYWKKIPSTFRVDGYIYILNP